jgi:dihydroorotate dehydrogenase
LRTHLAGLDLANPIGLAAGFDKDGCVADALLASGFGFVECGSVTPRAQAGNPRPRLFRLAEDRAAINRMGFNNAGVDAFAARLAARAGKPGIVGANIGANKDTEDRAADYVAGLAAVWPHAAYVAINVSSPNTPGLRELQGRGALDDLLGRLAEARAALSAEHGRRPLFLKLAPDLDEQAMRDIAEAALAFAVDGLIVSNTTIERPARLRSPHGAEPGGLSGRPLFARSTQALRTFAQILGPRMALVGSGGVEDAATALAKLKAGAGAVQLYTALVFEGPGLVARLLRDLDAALAAEGFASVADAVGADLR